jgi:two-component system KDP operon response regulator KdpE
LAVKIFFLFSDYGYSMSETRVRILIVDDERPIRRFLHAALSAHGYEIFEATTGQEALNGVIQHRPDLLILDLGLPDMDGVTVTRRLREWTTLPILILSVRDRETDKITALDAGADDYLTKPFSTGELMARLRVALRHTVSPTQEAVFEANGLVVDTARRLVTVNGNEIALTPTEYDLLRLLVTHADKVLTHQQILRQVWGVGYDTESPLLRVNISNLRRKIEPEPARPRYIFTEPGVGYRLKTGL